MDNHDERIIYGGPFSPSLNSDSNGSQGDFLEIDSMMSLDSSPGGFPDLENYSEQSNESVVYQPSNPPQNLPAEYYEGWLNYLLECRDNPKQLGDLNGTKATSETLSGLVNFINRPEVQPLLQHYGFTEYNNELQGVFIQSAAKEFKRSDGFDEPNFPFKDSGGPQKGKLADYGYLYKYWVGKIDNSLKMRKFYKENGQAIIVVFRDASPCISPSSSSEISVSTEPANKKARVGDDSPFSSSVGSSLASSPTRLSNTNQPSATSTNYSQQPILNNSITTTTSTKTKSTSNDLRHSPEHMSDRIDSISDRVDDLASRMTKVELNTATNKPVTMNTKQRDLGKLIVRVLRENGSRHQMGKPLATKVRKLVGGTLDTKDVNNVLYTVFQPLGIVQLQDKEWVLIDETKAQEFEQQQ